MVNNITFLLDTHVFIWWMEEKKLSKEITEIINNPNNRILLSLAVVWEIIIKKRIGKIKLPKNWLENINNGIFEILPIEFNHVLSLDQLPSYHHDPFDRMLISQTIFENAQIITADKKIWKYKVGLIKA